jgi:hypothetical protein
MFMFTAMRGKLTNSWVHGGGHHEFVSCHGSTRSNFLGNSVFPCIRPEQSDAPPLRIAPLHDSRGRRCLGPGRAWRICIGTRRHQRPSRRPPRPRRAAGGLQSESTPQGRPLGVVINSDVRRAQELRITCMSFRQAHSLRDTGRTNNIV